MDKLSILKKNVEVFGLFSTARAVLAHLVAPSGNDRYDRRYGVDTSGYVPVADSDIEGAGKEHASPYQPTHWRVMNHVFANLGIDPSQFCFVDYGCGKGRAVLMASELPFKQVIGVELSESYCRVARKNLEDFLGTRRCGAVHIEQANALDYELPRENLVLYLFNSFLPPLLNEVLHAVRRSGEEHPREILLAYLNPSAGLQPVVDAGFRKVLDARVIQPWWSWSLWKLESER